MSKKLQTYIMVLVVGILFLAAGPVLAVDTPTDNVVKMVTYFPVPYASFGNLYISKQLDVGCDSRAFAAEIGNSSCGNQNPTILADSVKFMSPDAYFWSDMDLYTHRARFGQWFAGTNNLYRDAIINITGNLRLGLTGSSATTSDSVIERLSASSINSKGAGMSISSGGIGHSMLPACQGTDRYGNAITSGDQAHMVRWTSLTFKGSTKTLLTCGPVISCYGTETLQAKCAAGSGHTGQSSHDTNQYGPGSWSDSNCTCSCPTGPYTDLQNNESCQHNCWNRGVTNGKMSNCSYEGESVSGILRYKKGTWSNSSCTCSCDSDYTLDSNGKCERRCVENIANGDVDKCQAGNDGTIVLGVDRYQSGEWTDDQCRCLCGQYKHYNQDARYNTVSNGKCQHVNWDKIVECSKKGNGYTWDNVGQNCVAPASGS